nr:MULTISPECIES: DUF6531 domain-containing protein [unclassified Pseudonocardia]
MEVLVNLANGNLVVRNKDLAFAGTGLNTAVNHVYNNQATNRGSFGQRWTMTTGRDVGLEVSDPGKVVLQGPTGYRQDYTRDGDGFRSPSGANATLTRTDDGYELRFDKSKERWRFDDNGFFTSQVDRNDNTTRYRYNPTGTLASIEDTRGAVTTFAYDVAGRVTRMTDPTGYEYGPYDYDLAGRHTGFRDPSGKRVAYGYDDTGNLTTITDPNGNEYRLRYDDQRRVVAVDEPRETGVLQDDRAVTTYEYTSDTETRSTNPAGGNLDLHLRRRGPADQGQGPAGPGTVRHLDRQLGRQHHDLGRGERHHRLVRPEQQPRRYPAPHRSPQRHRLHRRGEPERADLGDRLRGPPDHDDLRRRRQPADGQERCHRPGHRADLQRQRHRQGLHRRPRLEDRLRLRRPGPADHRHPARQAAAGPLHLRLPQPHHLRA